ncbi:MAG: 50S ribosomal protein L21 [Elusimicrobiota bacterium]
MKYAVVDNGRNQEIVSEGDLILVDDLNLEKGKEYTWDKVLMVRDEENVDIGKPYLEDKEVKGTVGNMVKGPKVINFKKKRRKGYSRKVGHRQKFTEVKVEEIK